jgi:hypothetical protein
VDFDDGGNGSLGNLSDAHTAGYKILKSHAESSQDEGVLVDVYSCGRHFIGNVIHRVANLGQGNG